MELKVKLMCTELW